MTALLFIEGIKIYYTYKNYVLYLSILTNTIILLL